MAVPVVGDVGRVADVVAVDWSGARTGAASRIWLAHVRRGTLLSLRGGLQREEVIDELVALRQRCPDGLVVGLDFAFSFPAWFMAERGYPDVGHLWRVVRDEGERWLTQCDPPFWGRPGRTRPPLREHYRRCEKAACVGAVRAKSVFQVGGGGSVGTGSIRGMPHLIRLRDAGFGIWPFDPASPWTVLEIYPRLLTGPVRKSDPVARSRYVSGSDAFTTVAPSLRAAAAASEDAFDAAVSALAMSNHALALARLSQADDPVTLLEGDVWPPPNITA